MTGPATHAHRHVTGLVTRRCEQVIRDELVRLDHRQPALSSTQLAVVEQSLTALADRLLLNAIRRHPDHLDAVEALFALDDDRPAEEKGTS